MILVRSPLQHAPDWSVMVTIRTLKVAQMQAKMGEMVRYKILGLSRILTENTVVALSERLIRRACWFADYLIICHSFQLLPETHASGKISRQTTPLNTTLIIPGTLWVYSIYRPPEPTLLVPHHSTNKASPKKKARCTRPFFLLSWLLEMSPPPLP